MLKFPKDSSFALLESVEQNARLLEEIESLRQQLAAALAERDAYMRDYGMEQDAKRAVAQKLAAAIRD